MNTNHIDDTDPRFNQPAPYIDYTHCNQQEKSLTTAWHSLDEPNPDNQHLTLTALEDGTFIVNQHRRVLCTKEYAESFIKVINEVNVLPILPSVPEYETVRDRTLFSKQPLIGDLEGIKASWSDLDEVYKLLTIDTILHIGKLSPLVQSQILNQQVFFGMISFYHQSTNPTFANTGKIIELVGFYMDATFNDNFFMGDETPKKKV